jgi:hypothetical protein
MYLVYDAHPVFGLLLPPLRLSRKRHEARLVPCLELCAL